jgi:mannan endo-1,6-alpha-mannosidase
VIKYAANMRIQMQALAVIGATTMHPEIAPKTANNGGTSQSDPGAGSDIGSSPVIEHSEITTADRAGAAILTIVVIGVIVGGSVWIIL